MQNERAAHFEAHLVERDPLIHEALMGEALRQSSQIELIASENTVSRACLETLGSSIANKTLEGYPGARFHGGAEFADVVENAAIERACALFGAAFANVQPHSGTQANQAVFQALLRPGDQVLSMDLAAGGHLSHGAKANQSGRYFEVAHYGVSRETQRIDYDEVQRIADDVRPKLLIAGGSAYPREIDFERMRRIADEIGALLLVDMAHFAGLVAAGAHPNPLPHADVVTCTSTKTLRGPRGGLILTNSEDLAAKLGPAVFPGVQGSIHTQVIAAKAVALGEALRPEFKDYGQRVVANARRLAAALGGRGLGVVAGGSDTHLVLIDLSGLGLKGSRAQAALETVAITSNANPIPFDAARPADWVGLRFGTASATTRGLDELAMAKVGHIVADVLEATAAGEADSAARLAHARASVEALCTSHPLYSWL